MDRSGTQLVIVALPRQSDPVRKVSSEKEPHLTLLYLGKNDFSLSELTMIGDYVEHASTFLPKFYLDVESRGELGDKKADVLFFNKQWTKEIETFRSHLLKNDLVSTAYQSADQFPDWTPHLTLGYPDSPAKKHADEYPEYTSVSFDRVALWVGDFVGPTYELKNHEYPEVAMSDMRMDASSLIDSLSHYGVKGMRWGVTTGDSPAGKKPSRKVRKADAKFEKNADSMKTWIKVHNMAAEHANKHDVDRINNKLKYKDKDFTKPSKLRDEYYAEHQKAFSDALHKAAASLGTNASGTRKYVIGTDVDGNWGVMTKEVEHADDFLMTIIPKYDATGHIVSLIIKDPDELKHYGIKGMKWGVTRENPSGGKPTSKKEPAGSADHRSAEKAKNKIAAGGTKSLSNQELQGLLNRMNLEQRYNAMATQPKGKGFFEKTNEKVAKALGYAKTYEEVKKFMATPTGQAIKTGVFGAAAAGAAYATGGASAAAGAGAGIVIRRRALGSGQ